MSNPHKFAMLVGGGPAPGINSVISAATIRAHLQGMDVVGVHDGFSGIMKGRLDGVRDLTFEEVSRIHFRGGSYLGTSRANPTRQPAHLDQVVASLAGLGVTRLITIGGDDTAFAAMKVAERAGDRLSPTYQRPSTTTYVFPRISIRSAFRPRGTSPWDWSRT